MSTTTRIYAGSALAVAALVALFALVARVSSAPAADSPVEIVSIVPADGAVLADPPDAVQIHVPGRPDARQSHIAVYDGDNVRLNTGQLSTEGDDGLRQTIGLDRPATLTVAYHIVTTDGRDVSGIARFTVGAAGVTNSPAMPPVNAHAHGVDPFGAALLAVDGLALLVVVALLVRRRGDASRS
ncbi:copper resistance protein CopC [Micromonospora sp. 15K316]|uniref:copper resistance CopC family protein n=1 Tax=Micromonospora sp. 15K316 TaxID=2530376 RepID=UPI00104BFBC1|nr:copper resistance protein CopC [Micromonospora sp. 15K316]TDC37388.1 copper resistance protein CopC [Micromonospora sp. 15K316]